eukprot:6211463-Pleurochrysis_carterae.AAC.6
MGASSKERVHASARQSRATAHRLQMRRRQSRRPCGRPRSGVDAGTPLRTHTRRTRRAHSGGDVGSALSEPPPPFSVHAAGQVEMRGCVY